MKKITSILDARKEKGVLIAAHRGMVGGNIPHNTIPAFEAALNQGTDILETDVTMSGDGVIFIFHPRQEKNQLKMDVHLEEMTAEEIKKLRHVNSCNAYTEWGPITLDEFLEHYKDRCFINLDHGWNILPEMVAAVRRHKMEEQILLKAPAKPEYLKIVEQVAPDMMYMPICKELDEITPMLESMDVNYIAAELVFAKDDSPLVSEEYLQMHHDKGRLLWCNAILYNYLKPLSGGHTDDVAVMGDPDNGWGWIADKGFDIIQTDWSLPLRQYLDGRK